MRNSPGLVSTGFGSAGLGTGCFGVTGLWTSAGETGAGAPEGTATGINFTLAGVGVGGGAVGRLASMRAAGPFASLIASVKGWLHLGQRHFAPGGSGGRLIDWRQFGHSIRSELKRVTFVGRIRQEKPGKVQPRLLYQDSPLNAGVSSGTHDRLT